MGRPRNPDAKRVTLTIRLAEEQAARLDHARGRLMTRVAWAEEIIARELQPVMPSFEGQCPPHPRARVHKGLCGACGRHVEGS